MIYESMDCKESCYAVNQTFFIPFFFLFFMVGKKGKKCIVMLSGGLDSRLAVKIMQEQGFDVLALFFRLPFGAGCCDENCSFNFSQLQGVELKIVNCSKGKLLHEYLGILKNPQYGTGAGVNPCVDCRIFMFKKAREFADKEGIELVVTGEVIGERPMSQRKKPMNVIEEQSGLKGRLLRPLSAKLLPETEAEKRGIVDRSKLYSIYGRKRDKQIALAKRFKISYPSPAGGCLLCEKALSKRFLALLDRGMNEEEIKVASMGRHFFINKKWVVLGRNEKENKILEAFKGDYELRVPDFSGPSALILDKTDEDTNKKVDELIKAYSKLGSLEERKKFEKYKL